MASLCEILSNENKEEKIKWLKSKWGYTYDRAIDISTKTNRNFNLYLQVILK
jgi:archaellum biogenesis protein FlaJ (TadC family)